MQAVRFKLIFNLKNIITGLAIFFVLLLTIYHLGDRYKHQKNVPTLNALLLSEIAKKRQKIDNKNMIYFLDVKESSYLPFLGNGYIGVQFNNEESRLYYSIDKMTLMSPVAINPLFRPKEDPGIYFLDLGEGYLEIFYLYPKIEGVLLRETVAVHRGYKSLIVQKFDLENDSDKLVNIDLNFPFIESQRLESFDLPDFTAFPVSGDSKCLFIRSKNGKISSDPRRNVSVTFLTFFVCNEESRPFTQPDAQAIINEVLGGESLTSPILDQHLSIWKNARRSSFQLSHSKAPKAVNSLLVMATSYYIFSTAKVRKTDASFFPSLEDLNGCYSGAPTLQIASLWAYNLRDLDQIFGMSRIWLMTLANRGCLTALGSINGIGLSFILSLGSLKLTRQHIEMNMSPVDMHREMTLLNVRFGYTFLNIKISLGTNNKPLLSLWTTHEHVAVYACGGACLPPAIKLESHSKSLVVKQTVPETAILYVSTDLGHINMLKDAIHITSVNDAPPHGSEIITMHRHGSLFGELPGVFWVIVVTVVGVPHIALAVCIYKEFLRSGRN